MARYVVIEFQDNEDAESFIQQLDSDNSARRKEGEPFLRRVVGIFVRPGKLCDCPDWQTINAGDKNAKHGVERGAKFGWWVCTRCNRPRRAGHQLNNQIVASETFEGKNDKGYEMTVTGLQVTGIAIANIDRPKKFRQKKEK